MLAAYFSRKFLMIQLFRVILVPLGNLHDDVGRAVWHSLAAKSRFRGDAWRFVEFVEFCICRFVTGFQSLSDDDVARGARTNSAAGVVEAGLQRLGKIQDASRQTVVPVGNLSWIYLDRFAAGQKSYFELFCRRCVLCLFDVRICPAHTLLLRLC